MKITKKKFQSIANSIGIKKSFDKMSVAEKRRVASAAKAKVSSNLLDEYWTAPAPAKVETPAGIMLCWYEEHDEGADRGGYQRKAKIDGEVFTENAQDGWIEINNYTVVPKDEE